MFAVVPAGDMCVLYWPKVKKKWWLFCVLQLMKRFELRHCSKFRTKLTCLWNLFCFILCQQWFLTSGKAVEYVYFYVSPEQARGLALPGRILSSSEKLKKMVLDSPVVLIASQTTERPGIQLPVLFRERMLIGVTELSSSKVVNSANSQIMNVARLIGWLNLAKPQLCLTE